MPYQRGLHEFLVKVPKEEAAANHKEKLLICMQILAFSTEAVSAVVDSYLPIVQKHRDAPYTEQNKEWQQMRRCARALSSVFL